MIIKIHSSQTGRTKIQHTIHSLPTSGTYADYLLLKENYKVLDPDRAFTNREWYKRVRFSTKFLAKHLALFGSLQCVYCGLDGLIIFPYNYPHKNWKMMASADHFHPISKEGSRFESNMVVSCHLCNQKKKNKVLPRSFLKYLKYHPQQPKEWITL